MEVNSTSKLSVSVIFATFGLKGGATFFSASRAQSMSEKKGCSFS